MSSPAGGNEPPRSTPIVTAYEAKNGMGRLLDRVEQGETIVITRHGRPVARLMPYLDPDHTARVSAAFAVFDRIRGKARLDTDEIVTALRRDRDR